MARNLKFETLEPRRLLAFEPTGAELELLQLVNRFRTDPAGEFDRLFVSATPLVARDAALQADLDFAAVDGPLLKSELASLSPRPALAWNAGVASVAAGHNQQMVAAGQQFHSNSLARRQALLDAGVNLRFANGETISSENVFGFGKSPLHVFAAYIVDWQAGQPGGMQPDRPHRRAIMNDQFEEIGHALTQVGSGNFGPWVNTQVLVNIENPPTWITGAFFQDLDGSGWYDSGEGLGGIQIEFDNGVQSFATTSTGSGSYQVALPPGTYTAVATGGPLNFPLRQTGISVGTSNLWVDWIYDPNAIPPDAQEPNDTFALATAVDAGSQIFEGTIHDPADVDLYALVAASHGGMVVTLDFDHTQGDLDLFVLDASGNVLSVSQGTGDREQIALDVVRGQSHFIRVQGKSGAVNGQYALRFQSPLPQPPIARPDRRTLDVHDSAILDILTNDVDPDGDATGLVPALVPPVPSGFDLDGNGKLRFDPPPATLGPIEAQYRLTDDQGLVSEPATVRLFVIDLQRPAPWQNGADAADVNGDATVTPLDALLIVNVLNLGQLGRLPISPENIGEVFGFLDPSGDGFVSPLDALIVINRLNASGGGGEGPAAAWPGPARSPDAGPDPWTAEPSVPPWQAVSGWSTAVDVDARDRKNRRMQLDGTLAGPPGLARNGRLS